jgi:hypothetical protein
LSVFESDPANQMSRENTLHTPLLDILGRMAQLHDP